VRRANDFWAARRRVRIPEPFRDILSAMEIQNPSAGRRSRTNFFIDHLAVRKHVNDETYQKILQMLHEQNNAVLTLRAALDRWANELRADAVWLAAVAIVLQYEATVNECPEVPRIREDGFEKMGVFLSREMRHRLRPSRLFQEPNDEEVREIAYWKAKIAAPLDFGDEPSISFTRRDTVGSTFGSD
jgi:hypothetical protein